MKISNKAQLQEVVTNQVEDAFNKLFIKIHKLAKTTSGDIDTGASLQFEEQQEELVTLLKKRFINLITQTVWWNMPEGQEDYLEAMRTLGNKLKALQ